MPELTNAVQRAAAQRQLNAMRLARLTASICRIAALQPSQPADKLEADHFVLAENLGNEHKPLWVYLSTKQQDDGQHALAMAGSGQAVRFAGAHVVELAPLLGLLMGNLEFMPASQVCARNLTKFH